MQPSEVKRLTIWEARLYSLQEKETGGSQWMKPGDARAAVIARRKQLGKEPLPIPVVPANMELETRTKPRADSRSLTN